MWTPISQFILLSSPFGIHKFFLWFLVFKKMSHGIVVKEYDIYETNSLKCVEVNFVD